MSEEFLYTVLQQVDNLCDIIRNGDADLERTLEVNQNLNNAVSCYRVKLMERRHVVDGDSKVWYFSVWNFKSRYTKLDCP